MIYTPMRARDQNRLMRVSIVAMLALFPVQPLVWIVMTGGCAVAGHHPLAWIGCGRRGSGI